MKINLKHFNTIARTPALPLIARGWVELIDNDLDSGGIPVAWDNKAIVAFNTKGDAVGVISWGDQEWSNQLTIYMAYVVPEYRRQGVHTRMFAALIKKARELKRPVISSGAALDNVASRQAQQRQGRRESFIVTEFKIPQRTGRAAASGGKGNAK